MPKKFSRSPPRINRLISLLNEMEALESDFEYFKAIDKKVNRRYVEEQLGIVYRAVMREVTESNLQQIIPTDDSYILVVKK